MRRLSLLALVVSSLAACDTRRPQSEPPTAVRAAEVGREATWTFTVVETKFARRRQMHFLSSSLNFRGSENQAVAIAAGDFAAFRDAGLEDLDAAYLGKRITARGKLFEDEGQLLLRITSPKQIQISE
jgi:hypothetical protein